MNAQPVEAKGKAKVPSMNFQDKLKVLLARTRANQAKLAEYVGVDASQISQWKLLPPNGGGGFTDWSPTRVQAMRLAHALGVPTDWLVDDEKTLDDLEDPDPKDAQIEANVRSLGRDEALRRLLGVPQLNTPGDGPPKSRDVKGKPPIGRHAMPETGGRPKKKTRGKK